MACDFSTLVKARCHFFAWAFVLISIQNLTALDCNAALEQYAKLTANALVDSSVAFDSPYKFLRELLGEEGLRDAKIKEFEDEIIEIYDSPLENRKSRWHDLQKRWKLNNDSLATLEAYYSLLVYDGNSKIVGDKTAVFARVKELTLEHLFTKNPSLRERYNYYQDNLGKLSVPEMASHLKIKQSAVYRELSFFGLGIEKAFKGKFGKGETQASRFIRHYLDIENRGTTWDRLLANEREDMLLMQMQKEEMSPAEIANVLNGLAGVIQSDNPELRTEAGVFAKLKQLGLTQSRPLEIHNLSIEPYGPVKISGSLVPATAVEFLFDHQAQGIEWCAKQLGLHPRTLYSFIERQHIEGVLKKDGQRLRQRAGKGPVKEQKPMDQQRLEAHDNVLTYINEHKKLPSANNWDIALGTIQERYFGNGLYKEGKANHEFRMHDSAADAFRGLLARAQDSTLLNALTDEERIKIKEEIELKIKQYEYESLSIKEKRDRDHDQVLKLIVSLKKIPTEAQISKVISVSKDRYFGKSRDGKPLKSRLHDDHADTFNQLLNRAIQTDAFKTLDSTLKGKLLSELSRLVKFYTYERLGISDAAKNFAHDNVLEYIAQNEKLPTSDNWEAALGISQSRYFGTGDYRSDAGKDLAPLHDNALLAYEGLLARAENTDTLGKLPPDKREKITQEIKDKIAQEKYEALPLDEKRSIAHDRVLTFIATKKALPTDNEWDAAIGFYQSRYFGTGKSAPGGKNSKSRLYDNPNDCYRDLVLRAENSPILNSLEANLRQQIISVLRARIDNSRLRKTD